MASFNKITLIGNVGNDPTLKQFDGGRKVAEFPLAINESYTDRSGTRIEKTEWYRISVWNQRADVVMQYLKKGNPVYVEGKLTVSTYKDSKTQDNKYSLDVLVSEFQLLGTKMGGGSDNSMSAPMPGVRSSDAAGAPNTQHQTFGKEAESDEEDLPF